MRIKPAIQGYIRGESGAVAVVFALFAVVFIGAMAISIDIGAWYLAQTKLQGDADLAATSAALNLDPVAQDLRAAPRQAAERTAIGNGLDSVSVKTIEPGQFRFDTAVPMEERLRAVTGAGQANAVTARLEQEVPLYFAKLFLPDDHLKLTATATAAKADYAAFTLGSRLAQLHEISALNSLLSAALGSGVNLTLLDYQSLLEADVGLLDFLDALGTNLNLQGADYKDILNSRIDTPLLLDTLLDLVPGTAATTALGKLGSGIAGETLAVRQLIALEEGVIDLHVNNILGPIRVSALDVLMASVDILNAQKHRIVDLPLSLSLPGIAGMSVELLVGERQANSGWVTVGATGASLHTAQIRLRIRLEVGSEVDAMKPRTGLGFTVIPLGASLPLYVEVASATATLTALNCRAVHDGDPVATFSTGNAPFALNPSDWTSAKRYFTRYNDGTPGGTNDGTAIAAIYIGEFDDDVLHDMSVPLSPQSLKAGRFIRVSLPLFGVSLLELQIRSAIYVGASREQQTVFTKAEVAGLGAGNGAVMKTIGSGLNVSGLVAALLNPNTIEVSLVPGQGVLGLVTTLLATVLGLSHALLTLLPGALIAFLLTPVDTLLNAVFDLLGLGIAEMDLALQGVSCGNIVLVR